MPPRSPIAPDAGVVVPLRSFSVGKARLASRLDPPARAALARQMADRVVDAARDLPVVVVSSDPDVVAWARERDVSCIDDPGTLDGAAHAGRAWVRDRGLSRAVVVHGDLPLATSFDAVASDGATAVVVAVPCHRGDGTPVLSVPVELDFRFAYGPGSFARHSAEATRSGAVLRIVRDPSLSFDVDVPEDLDLLEIRSRPLGAPDSDVSSATCASM